MKILIAEVSHCLLILNATFDLNITRTICNARVNYFTPKLIPTTRFYLVRVPMDDVPFRFDEQMENL